MCERAKVKKAKYFFNGTNEKIPINSEGEIRSITNGFAYVYFGPGLQGYIKLSHLKVVKEGKANGR